MIKFHCNCTPIYFKRKMKFVPIWLLHYKTIKPLISWGRTNDCYVNLIQINCKHCLFLLQFRSFVFLCRFLKLTFSAIFCFCLLEDDIQTMILKKCIGKTKLKSNRNYSFNDYYYVLKTKILICILLHNVTKKKKQKQNEIR